VTASTALGKLQSANKEKQIVITILSKIGLEFSIFVSKFCSSRFASRATWKMPSLEDFIESMTQEQTKLINMGKMKGSKAYALTLHDVSHQYHKYKDK
jgi:3-dehydroquinate synthase class II